jgi:hypothetical protein
VRAGCALALAFYSAVALVILKPALLPVLVTLVVVLVAVRAVLSKPDWPVY